MEMQNPTTFPIERLGFLLKLKVLSQLDAKDVIELVKVNRGFHSMISNRPLIVFGRHVHGIYDAGNNSEISIWKLLKSNEVCLDVSRHFALVKNIRSCNRLVPRDPYSADKRFSKNDAVLLQQLMAVGQLNMTFSTPQHLESLFRLSMKIKEWAVLPSFIQQAPSMKDLAEHFIETQLYECAKVIFVCDNDDDFHFCYKASKKTHIEHVEFLLRIEELNWAKAIQWIVSYGIPSDHPAADCFLEIFRGTDDDMTTTIVLAFLRGYPGMKQVSKKDPQIIVGWGKELVEWLQESFLWEETLFFRRSVDAIRDCIYMLSSDGFFAFYIKPDGLNVC